MVGENFSIDKDIDESIRGLSLEEILLIVLSKEQPFSAVEKKRIKSNEIADADPLVKELDRQYSDNSFLVVKKINDDKNGVEIKKIRDGMIRLDSAAEFFGIAFEKSRIEPPYQIFQRVTDDTSLNPDNFYGLEVMNVSVVSNLLHKIDNSNNGGDDLTVFRSKDKSLLIDSRLEDFLLKSEGIGYVLARTKKFGKDSSVLVFDSYSKLEMSAKTISESLYEGILEENGQLTKILEMTKVYTPIIYANLAGLTGKEKEVEDVKRMIASIYKKSKKFEGDFKPLNLFALIYDGSIEFRTFEESDGVLKKIKLNYKVLTKEHFDRTKKYIGVRNMENNKNKKQKNPEETEAEKLDFTPAVHSSDLSGNAFEVGNDEDLHLPDNNFEDPFADMIPESSNKTFPGFGETDDQQPLNSASSTPQSAYAPLPTNEVDSQISKAGQGVPPVSGSDKPSDVEPKKQRVPAQQKEAAKKTSKQDPIQANTPKTQGTGITPPNLSKNTAQAKTSKISKQQTPTKVTRKAVQPAQATNPVAEKKTAQTSQQKSVISKVTEENQKKAKTLTKTNIGKPVNPKHQQPEPASHVSTNQNLDLTDVVKTAIESGKTVADSHTTAIWENHKELINSNEEKAKKIGALENKVESCEKQLDDLENNYKSAQKKIEDLEKKLKPGFFKRALKVLASSVGLAAAFFGIYLAAEEGVIDEYLQKAYDAVGINVALVKTDNNDGKSKNIKLVETDEIKPIKGSNLDDLYNKITKEFSSLAEKLKSADSADETVIKILTHLEKLAETYAKSYATQTRPNNKNPFSEFKDGISGVIKKLKTGRNDGSLYDAVNNALANLKADFKQYVDGVSHQVGELEKENSEKSKKITDLEGELKEYESDAKKYTEEIQSLKRELKKYESDVEKYTKEVQSLKGELKKYESDKEIKSLEEKIKRCKQIVEAEKTEDKFFKATGYCPQKNYRIFGEFLNLLQDAELDEIDKGVVAATLTHAYALGESIKSEWSKSGSVDQSYITELFNKIKQSEDIKKSAESLRKELEKKYFDNK